MRTARDAEHAEDADDGGVDEQDAGGAGARDSATGRVLRSVRLVHDLEHDASDGEHDDEQVELVPPARAATATQSDPVLDCYCVSGHK